MPNETQPHNRTKALSATRILATLIACALVGTPCAADETNDRPLANDDLVVMQQAKIGVRVLLAAVAHSPLEALDASADALERLRGTGLPDLVITAVSERVASRNHQPESAVDGATRPRRPEDTALYHTQVPKEPYRELGRVSVQKFSTFGMTRKRAAIDEELRKKAFELGGNAVISISEDFASVSGVAVLLEASP